MAKGNLFLGFGRGAVGDVVMYHQAGEQIVRARNRKPKNPQTALQLLQRVCLKTSSMAYALMQDICNHSFQGCAEGTECQSRFNKLNIQRFREQLATVINSGDAEEIITCSDCNFSYNGASLVEINPYIVAEGSLPTVPVQWGASLGSPAFIIPIDLGSATPTYNDVLAALNMVSGDQLTFLALSCDDTAEVGQFNGFDYARVILEPASGELSEQFLDGNDIFDPNEKNRGAFEFGVSEVSGSYYLTFNSKAFTISSGRVNSAAASAVILSRSNGSIWQRSKQSLVIRPDRITVNGHLEWNHDIDYLGDAIQSFMTDTSSLLYLNQAGGSGQRGQMIAVGRLAAVSVGTNVLQRDGALTLRTNDGTLNAIMTGGASESVYKVALRAAGASTNFKEATFTSSSAQIANLGLVEDTVYSVVLLEDGEVIDTFGTITYTTAVEATISSVVKGSTPISEGSTGNQLTTFDSLTVVKSGGLTGATYSVGAVLHGQTTAQKSQAFSGDSATLAISGLSEYQDYDLVLLKGDTIIQTWCQFRVTSGD